MLQHNLFKVVLNHNARGFEQPDAIPFRHIGPRRNGTKELPGTIPINGSQGITSMSCSKRDGFSPPVTEKSFVSIRLQERRYGKMGLRGLGQGWRQLRLTEMGRTTSPRRWLSNDSATSRRQERQPLQLHNGPPPLKGN